MITAETNPIAIKKKGNRSLEISWEDGHVSLYSFRYLRQNCSCAGCVEEWTGKKVLDKDVIPLDLLGLKAATTGNYALSFSFSDHHDTGIYHFDHLREICPCVICKE
ncbi:MAG: DUF971 domain-containing protein [Nitrospirae bacterium]|nr:DUF971 domain-containing protein [Candidatus Troglogloeales bacterium]